MLANLEMRYVSDVRSLPGIANACDLCITHLTLLQCGALPLLQPDICCRLRTSPSNPMLHHRRDHGMPDGHGSHTMLHIFDTSYHSDLNSDTPENQSSRDSPELYPAFSQRHQNTSHYRSTYDPTICALPDAAPKPYRMLLLVKPRWCRLVRGGRRGVVGSTAQNLSVSSPDPVTTVQPSGLWAMQHTRAVCPERLASRRIAGVPGAAHTSRWLRE